MEKGTNPKTMDVQFSSDITKDESTNSGHDLSQIKQIYSSKDGCLSVYQDAEGHLVSVDTRNFSS